MDAPSSSQRRDHAPISILNSLNEAQCRAVCSEAPTVAIMAGPGSGKTHTLTSRVVWLVDTIGYQPQNVIVATFTVKASREMGERIGKALGDGRSKPILGTFHSIARRYLAAYGKRIGLEQNFSIADDGDSRAIINRLCKRLQLSIDPVQARAWISKRKAKGSQWNPTPLRRKHSGEAKEGARAFESCYREYQDHLERSSLLDYDDLLVRCVELLRAHPACVSNVEAVLIDEFQDTNGIQYDLMRLLAQKRNRITIVGDPDQSIYGWRSAEIGNLRRLFAEFPQTTQVSLEENYRSSQAILDMALRVIKQDANRYDKVLKPIHDKGTRPVLRRLKTSTDEARWIVLEISRICIMSGKMLGYDDIAILLRSASLSRQIESALGNAGIPYRMVGGFKFYERAEIKTMLDYLRVIHQPDNNDALARILNVPKRGVGEATIKALVEEAERSSQSLWGLLVKHCRGDRLVKVNLRKPAEQRISGEVIRLVLDIQKKIREPPAASPYGLVDIIDEVLTRLSFEKFLQDTYREDHESRWANIQEFRVLGNDFAKEQAARPEEQLPEIAGLDQTEDTDVLARFLANISLASDAQKGQEEDTKPMVTISTIHAAKGLEWPVTFIPAAYNGSIPHSRSEDTDEERRLLYVAMTRAQALLYLSCPLTSTSYGGQSEVQLSDFLEPVGKTFAKIGPDLEHHRMEAIGRILGREVPSQQAVYSGLPLGFSPNDDELPEDPESNQSGRDSTSAWDGEAWSGDSYQRKRPRLNGPTHSTALEMESTWTRGYSTTLEQKSCFTMVSQSGFISAGAHQAALSTTRNNDASMAAQLPKAAKPSTKKGQTTLFGFIKSNSTADRAADSRSSVKPHNDCQIKRMNNHLQARPIPPTIDPVLSNHQISTHTGSKPSKPASTISRGVEPNRYAQFSSPPRSPAVSDDQTGPDGGQRPMAAITAPATLSTTAPRPASTFHNTTVNMQRTSSGVKRPSGLSAPRDDAAALQKLRKPFRPLTINRS